MIRVNKKLYLFSILHQTTTVTMLRATFQSCIYSVFYIKPQRLNNAELCGVGCIYSIFYIKPQPSHNNAHSSLRCIYSIFYIKPPLEVVCRFFAPSCIYSIFYIKPQHSRNYDKHTVVVSIQYSTSNHNSWLSSLFAR